MILVVSGLLVTGLTLGKGLIIGLILLDLPSSVATNVLVLGLGVGYLGLCGVLITSLFRSGTGHYGVLTQSVYKGTTPDVCMTTVQTVILQVMLTALLFPGLTNSL